MSLNTAYDYLITKLTGITTFSDNLPVDSTTNCVAIRCTNGDPNQSVNGVIQYVNNIFNVYVKGNQSSTDTVTLAESVATKIHNPDDGCFVTESPNYAFTDEHGNIVMILRCMIISQ